MRGDSLFIRLDAIEMQSELPPKTGFNITAFKGWNDGAPARAVSDDAIPMGDGDFDVPVFKGSRVVTIEGFCIADSVQELGILQGKLTGLGSTGNRMRLTVAEFGREQWANCRPDGTPEFDATDGLPRATFAVDVKCRDPRKFGDTRTFASGALAFHYGNYPATPQLLVTGSMPTGYTINGPAGKKYIVTAAVTSTASHLIDMNTGLLYVNGVVVYGAVSQGDTWSIPPGQQVAQTLVPASGTGTLAAQVMDTHV